MNNRKKSRQTKELTEDKSFHLMEKYELKIIKLIQSQYHNYQRLRSTINQTKNFKIQF